ncbi:MAG: DNA-directed RNA polymerase subunit alpha [Candidatus Paceibacterota bacterium]|jgi:DNA-directed RNA polymerase subunit alpha|nr:DNA-directed RNA polymerase subunit alpha [Candidatus Paceibacterota bacterium]
MIPLPSTPTIIEKKENSAVFKVEGLYPGYGVTIGNSLRRVLLSSLEGAAITQVKIKGAPHEFSTLPGVMEDVVNILINLKQLRLKLHGEEPQKARLQVKGEKTVTGSDFELPTQLELINKDNHVATLTSKKAELEIEIQVEKGMGYEPVEMRKKGKLEIGTIAVDAIFTPIRKVSYKVENMRVGDRTNYDRLFVEVETDGSISPEEAMVTATEIFMKHLSMMEEAFRGEAEIASAAAEAPAKKTAAKKKATKKTSTKKNEEKKKRKKTK